MMKPGDPIEVRVTKVAPVTPDVAEMTRSPSFTETWERATIREVTRSSVRVEFPDHSRLSVRDGQWRRATIS